jgi:uncharacterized membrane protein YphA (DoxX/SURF4 family)
LQRLFSTFANGSAGVALLLQRILTAVLLIRCGIIELTATPPSVSITPQIIASCAGIFLLVGLWTPIMGTVIGVIEIWLTMTHPDEPWIFIVLATLGATAAMIGPGAWSIDARLFGRKHIET